jgi:diguanylate cyclase (GGDEF)-like protein
VVRFRLPSIELVLRRPDGTVLFRLGRAGFAAADRPEALADPLTGVLTRPALMALQDREIARARRTGQWPAVAIIDFDDFKRINDRFGHVVGDQVLVEAATRFGAAMRDGDLLARLGGEEFGILMPDTPAALAKGVVERLLAALEAPISTDAGPLDVRATAGVGVPRPQDPVGAAWGYAEKALYYGKTQGRGQVHVARRGMSSEAWARFEELSYLARYDRRTGLRNAGEFDRDHEALLAQVQADGRAYGLFLADIDFFHSYNRHHGQLAGHETLGRVARALEDAGLGGVAYRYGGEEFMVLVPDVDVAALPAMTERLRAAVEAAGIPHSGRKDGVAVVTVTVAATAGTGADRDTAEVINRVDDVLMALKNSNQRNSAGVAPI